MVIRFSNAFACVGRVRAPARVLKQQISASELINTVQPVQKCLHPLQALEISGSLQAEAPACLHLSMCTYPVCKCELIPKPRG